LKQYRFPWIPKKATSKETKKVVQRRVMLKTKKKVFREKKGNKHLLKKKKESEGRVKKWIDFEGLLAGVKGFPLCIVKRTREKESEIEEQHGRGREW